MEFSTQDGIRRAGATALLLVVAASVGLCASFTLAAPPDSAVKPASDAHSGEPLRLVVMDPLAEPLSCACVRGVGQRKYNRLADFVKKKIGRPIQVVYEEGLGLAIGRMKAAPHLVIGKSSVVEFDARDTKTPLRPIARLTDRQGKTTVTGSFLVRKDDTARQIADLAGRKVMLGPVEHAEANATVLAALRAGRVLDKNKTDTAGSIEEAVFAVTDKAADVAIVPDFLPPLLEGCGKIEPGSLRIIGRTEPTPFVTVFAADSVSPELEERIVAALLAVAGDEELLNAIESKAGFVLPDDAAPGVAGSDMQRKASPPRTWTDWRGPGRIGFSPGIPARLPERSRVFWSVAVTGPAMAGISADQNYVIVADKDRDLSRDIFRCLKADTGEQLWKIQYKAEVPLDYTNAPRAAPVMHDGKVYLLGALGDLHCVQIATGRVLWKTNLPRQFKAELLHWGCTSPPLLVDGRLIVNPGAKDASLVALNPDTGEVLWQTPGHAAAYAAFIAGEFGGRRQIVGYDSASLGGWDIQTGQRLWQVVPDQGSDFNVGTPVPVDGRLLVATENNATRLYDFKDGKADPKFTSLNNDYAPDTCTPVVVGQRAFGTAYGELYCLDLNNDLQTIWRAEDDMFYDHVHAIAGWDRVMLWTATADLLLIRADTDKYELVSHWRPFDKDSESMSHPAIVGDRIYLRDQNKLICASLVESEKPEP